MLHQGKVDNPWMESFNLPSADNEVDDDENEEESKDQKPALQEEMEPEVAR